MEAGVIPLISTRVYLSLVVGIKATVDAMEMLDGVLPLLVHKFHWRTSTVKTVAPLVRIHCRTIRLMSTKTPPSFEWYGVSPVVSPRDGNHGTLVMSI